MDMFAHYWKYLHTNGKVSTLMEMFTYYWKYFHPNGNISTLMESLHTIGNISFLIKHKHLAIFYSFYEFTLNL